MFHFAAAEFTERGAHDLVVNREQFHGGFIADFARHRGRSDNVGEQNCANAGITLVVEDDRSAMVDFARTHEQVGHRGIDLDDFISDQTVRFLMNSARRLGIGLAVVLRLALLGTVALIVRLTEPVFTLMDHAFSWRDLILIGGGLFLVFKATTEIHHTVDPKPADEPRAGEGARIGFAAPIAQILLLFSRSTASSRPSA